MTLSIEIPDEAVSLLVPEGQDPARVALEAMAIEGYRSGALTTYQTRKLLGFNTRYQLDGFLKAHNVMDHAYSLEDLEHDRASMQRLENVGLLAK
jgi:hypothetical protein